MVDNNTSAQTGGHQHAAIGLRIRLSELQELNMFLQTTLRNKQRELLTIQGPSTLVNEERNPREFHIILDVGRKKLDHQIYLLNKYNAFLRRQTRKVDKELTNCRRGIGQMHTTYQQDPASASLANSVPDDQQKQSVSLELSGNSAFTSSRHGGVFQKLRMAIVGGFNWIGAQVGGLCRCISGLFTS